jgi:hypothetical protein
MNSKNEGSISEPRMAISDIGDYDYIIKTIQYLEYNFQIHLFITTRDFDILYNWWEKRIPLNIIFESISTVVKRWKARGKTIKGFSNFSYEVRKSFKRFLELSIGRESSQKKEKYYEINRFFKSFPPELRGLKKDLENIFIKMKKGQDISLQEVDKKLLDLFKDDDEIKLKTRIFMKSLADELRKPAVEKKYRLNYIKHKYGIPDFEIL